MGSSTPCHALKRLLELTILCDQRRLVTLAPDGAKAFCSGLFGWTWKVSGKATAKYFEILRQNEPIGGMLPMEGESRGDVPSHWVIYFLVSDCDAAVSKVAALGGGATVPATNIPNAGRFAALRDDQGRTSRSSRWLRCRQGVESGRRAALARRE